MKESIKNAYYGIVPVATAATNSSGANTDAINELLAKIISLIILPIVWVAIALAVVVFIWGVVQFVMHADDPKARETGWQHILWGIIGFAIIMCAYGIVRLVTNTIGVPPPF